MNNKAANMRLLRLSMQATSWLAPYCLLVLAFQISTEHQVNAIQQANEQSLGSSDQSSVAQSGPTLMSMGSESSSALESSANLAGDDLIAAESSQSPDPQQAEHKAFTNAQIVRQQDMPASIAPVFVSQQQQQQHQAQAQMQQQAHFAMNQPQIQARIQHPVQQQQHQRPVHPFMAAALAGNYGHAQQQMAAAAAAAAGLHAPGSHAHFGPQQQQAHHHPQLGGHMHPQAQHAHQLVNHQPQMHVRPGPQQPQQQVVAVAPAQESAVAPLAAQESSVRNNIVPGPNFNSVIDSNSIEMAESPAPSPQQQHQMTAAASIQHPVIASSSVQESNPGAWPLQAPDIPKIVNLEVKCEKNLMKVSIEFDKVFNGVIFSKGHYNQGQCLHVGQSSGKQQAYFDIGINSCGTQGNTQNGLYGMGGNTGSGTYFENTIVIQYDPNVQEVYDHARKLRCTWHDQYEKAVTFRPFPVDMLDIVRADFAGDNVGCWMQIQVGKGPWASEVAGIVKIGQTMTMVLAIKDEENKFDMLVRNCFAHDGKRGPIELVDKSGCITRPKLMSKFTKIKNFGSSATVLSYAHFQAFKFPDSMEVHFQCTIQICRHQCPEQCSAGPNAIGGPASESYSESTISGTMSINGRDQSAGSPDSVHLRKYGSPSLSRERRDLASSSHHRHQRNWSNGSHSLGSDLAKPLTQTVGVNRVIQVVSTGDLAFAIRPDLSAGSGDSLADPTAAQLTRVEFSGQVCMSSYNFVLSLVVLSLVLLCSCLVAISLYMRHKSLTKGTGSKLLVPESSSASSTMIRQQQVPIRHQNHHSHSVPSHDLHHHHHHDHYQSQLYGN